MAAEPSETLMAEGVHSSDPAGWRAVHKSRRIGRFSSASGQFMTRAPGLGREAGAR